MQLKKYALESTYWTEELVRLCSILNSKNASAGLKENWKPVSMISEQVKKKVCEIYIKRQKLSNMVDFIDWYRKDSELKFQCGLITKYDGNYYSYPKRRLQAAQMIKQIDEFLEVGLHRFEFLDEDCLTDRIESNPNAVIKIKRKSTQKMNESFYVRNPTLAKNTTEGD